MGTALKIEGYKFGKLVAIKPTNERKDKKVIWEFLCDCGNKVFIKATSVVNGRTKSCGCILSEVIQEKNKINRVVINCPVCKKDFTRKKSHADKSTWYLILLYYL